MHEKIMQRSLACGVALLANLLWMGVLAIDPPTIQQVPSAAVPGGVQWLTEAYQHHARWIPWLLYTCWILAVVLNTGVLLGERRWWGAVLGTTLLPTICATGIMVHFAAMGIGLSGEVWSIVLGMLTLWLTAQLPAVLFAGIWSGVSRRCQFRAAAE